MTTFESELRELLNRYGRENGSNTPDFVLADYLNQCLNAFDMAVRSRDNWFTTRERFKQQ